MTVRERRTLAATRLACLLLAGAELLALFLFICAGLLWAAGVQTGA